MNDSGKYVAIGAVAFGATLALLVVERLDNQALAMLTGALCGMAAGVPMTVVIFMLTQKQQREELKVDHEPRERTQPVIVVQPPTPAAQGWSAQGGPANLYPPARAARDFNIVGDEEDDHDDA